MDDLPSKAFKLARYLYRYKKLPPRRVLSCNLLPGGYALYPKNTAIEVTIKCNQMCAACWWANLSYAGKEEYLTAEMSLGEIKNTIDGIKNFIPSVGLTGGEPFARRDILEIVEYIIGAGLSVSILTNATLIDRQVATAIIDLGVEALGVSLDGDRSTHDHIRGIKGSFDKTVNALRTIQEIKEKKGREHPSLRINCVISSLNVTKLIDLVDIASELKVELQFQHVMWLTKETVERHKRFMREQFAIDDPTLDGLVDNFNTLNVDALIDVISEVKRKAHIMGVPLFFQQFNDEETVRTWYMSQDTLAGHSSCYYPYVGRIRANGDVTPCPYIRYTFGNIREESFRKIWNGKRARHFRQAFKANDRLFPGCIRCCKI